MRNTLAEYFGKVVMISGEYAGPAKGHERPFIDSKHEYYHVPGNVKRSNNPDLSSRKLEYKQPLVFIDHTSLLLNIKSADGTIEEDHVIIQKDLTESVRGHFDDPDSYHRFNIGDKVYIEAEVAKYERKNGEIDYCLVDVVILLPEDVNKFFPNDI